ncbi:cytosine deaminase [Arthrobacter sp. yr096]|uniref:amidohydrolase n=1 Tax=unclassified Arthrobacter TaxID=235627 RepID=UPI000899D459|nr:MULTISPECIES: amidohydrolase [unclassified Arthrobacter]SDX25107.1 cytosine deaminase [Arthrobacter sp. cf158]SEJ56406.1 cytosine deaminase [Arthrobacter sp. yr096]
MTACSTPRDPQNPAGAQSLLVTPGFVDAHIHPDKTTWGSGWLSRPPAQDLADLIGNDLKAQLSFEDAVEDRAYALMKHAVLTGTMAMRAHVDVGSQIGLKNIHGVRAAAERLASCLDVQIVAFPQFGLLTNPGTLDLMEAALSEGADLVGGIDPESVDGDLHGHLDAVFGLANRHGRDLDIHLHDEGPGGLAQLHVIAKRTMAEGMQGRVTIGHGFALCDVSQPELGPTLDAMAEAGIWMATCALGADPVPMLDLMERHGVKVVLGSDGVRDAWTPFGTGSMMDRAHLLGYRTGALTDTELERCFRIATTAGAELVGAEVVSGFSGTCSADRLEFAANSIPELVVDRPSPLRVVRGGRTLAL